MNNNKIPDKKDLNEMLNMIQNQTKISLSANIISSLKNKGNLDAAKNHADGINLYLSVNPGSINSDDLNCNFSVDVPLFFLATIFDNVEYFEYLYDKKYDYKITGHICLTQKRKNSVISNILGVACYYGSMRVLNFIKAHDVLKAYFMSDNQFSFRTTEKKNKDIKYSNNQKEMTGLTPILLSALNKKDPKLAFDIFHILYKIKQTSANDKDSDGNSILHLAVKSGNIYLVKYLINELKFDILDQNNEHLNSIMIANKENNVEIANFFSSLTRKNDQIDKDLDDLYNDDKNKKNKDKKKKKQTNNSLELSNFELKTISYPQPKVEPKQDKEEVEEVKNIVKVNVDDEDFKKEERKQQDFNKNSYQNNKKNYINNDNRYYNDYNGYNESNKGYYKQNNYYVSNKGYYQDNYKNDYGYQKYEEYTDYNNNFNYNNKQKYKERYNNSSIKKENVKIIKDIPIVNDNKNEHNTKVEFENKNLNENLNKVEVNNVECLSNNEYHQAVDGNIRCDNDNNDILSENVKANVEEFTNTIDNLVNEPLPIKLVNEEDLAANSESLDSLIVSLILLRQQIKTYLK